MATKKKKKKKKTTSSSSSSKKAAKKAAKRPAKKTAKKTAKKAVKKTAKKTAKKAAQKPTKKAAKKPTQKAAKKTSKSKSGVKIRGTRHEPSVMLLVDIPLPLQLDERVLRFDMPIDEALGDVGAVGGGGTWEQSCNLEVEVHDIARALPILRRVLVESEAPQGTSIIRLADDGAVEVLFEIPG